ncbi:DUF4291 domain-containing protein [Blastopirellula marina]|uniref:DUF4291 domain-containing protein n=1 Tax=Blastopirellula marina TaxID=124 RepID=A0A2S8GFH7_9BACT|nr:DUF4291 domain-containing protein [Blastopirellula marina]PQO30166.1 DUF4291 domain-containing protein [Blastopirellula marina]PQO43217.1 DUF4291 domain-containing protein [Blastopirellula marina]PTL42604.1 DUF4291 domain-containing protein [Blastopirellula marina]
MSNYCEIRADFDRETIVVYQAYNDAIANAALAAGRFVPPFSMQRMTWIKPSYLWLMERSGWGTKPNQTRILAVRILRSGWDAALRQAVLTSYSSRIHASQDAWRKQFKETLVHVQWDPERSLRGKKLEHRSIQVGVGRHLITEYAEKWTQEILDLTPLTAKLRQFRQQGDYDKAKRLLPRESPYKVDDATAARLGIQP